jgi:hypothetical protein
MGGDDRKRKMILVLTTLYQEPSKHNVGAAIGK